MLILVMGVTGSGKSTVGASLASRLGLPFHDADDFHSEVNRRKMAANQPLNDVDRAPWLERLAEESVVWEANGGAVFSCSALKQKYRDILLGRAKRSRVVYLDIPRAEIVRRLEARKGSHVIIRDYDRVLEGQYRDLEPPSDAITLPNGVSADEIVDHAARVLISELGLQPLQKL